MMRNIIRLFVVCCMSAFAMGCAQEELVPSVNVENVPDGYVTISGSMQIPQMQEIATRAADPDGYGVQNMTLFCFGSYGLFLTTVRAIITPTPPADGAYASTSGTFKASVPAQTEIIHFVCNQNMTYFPEDELRNHTEEQVLAALEGSSGRVIYWARFAKVRSESGANTADIAQQLKEAQDNGKILTLLRNQSRVRIDDSAKDDASGAQFFTCTGFEVANVYAFGTIAPFHRDLGFPTAEQWATDPNWANVVSLPSNKDKLSDLQDVKNETNIFIFEHPNTEEDPVSVIIRGKNAGDTEELYYRVMLLDESGNPVAIRRNCIYTIHIKGKLSFGQPTFNDALNAPATNNVWLSIDDEIRSIEDANYILSVERTSYIYSYATQQNNTFSLPFTLEGKNGNIITDADSPEVSWLEGQTVATNMNSEFTVDENGVGRGKVNVTLKFPFDEKREGTILIKKGKLRRKIKVITFKEQTFEPSWISTQIYGNVTDELDASSHVSVLFTIPETCPPELFPLKVLITAPDLDIRADDRQLPVIFEGDEDYGHVHDSYDGNIGYKYVYTAEAPGEHRVYLYSKLPQEDRATGRLWIEAKHFVELRQDYQYTARNRIITILDLQGYQKPGNFVKDQVPYYFVPQKKNAVVEFNLLLKEWDAEKNDYVSIEATDHAVFKVFTANMTPMVDDDPYFQLEGTTDVVDRDVWYFPSNPSEWGLQGKFWWFWQRPRRDGRDPVGFTGEKHKDINTGRYTMYLRTNMPLSGEMVRIASLEQGEASPRDLPGGNMGVLPDGAYYPTNPPGNEFDGYGWGGIGNCGNYGVTTDADGNPVAQPNTGVSYRSEVFEMTNYRPFYFYPEAYYGTDEEGNEKIHFDDRTDGQQSSTGQWKTWPVETVTQIPVAYGPNQKFDIELDITSFGTFENGLRADPTGKPSHADSISVDPFGTEFDVYIDAPMLSIDDARLAECNLTKEKFRPDPSVPGRFIYTVDKDRKEENKYGLKPAKMYDEFLDHYGEDLAKYNWETDADTLHFKELRKKERKRFPFVISQPVSAGEIVISSDESIVVFSKKKYVLSNPSITGRISYIKTGEETATLIRQGAFVTFERVQDASRIGSMQITSDGQYALRLRKEYKFNWYTDRIEVGYTDSDGVKYVASVANLADLFENRDLVLNEAGPAVVN